MPQDQCFCQFRFISRGHRSLLSFTLVVQRFLPQTTNACRVHEQNTCAGFARGTAGRLQIRLGLLGPAVEKSLGKLKASSGLGHRPGPD